MSQNDYSANLTTAIKYLELHQEVDIAELLRHTKIIEAGRPFSLYNSEYFEVKLQVPLELYDLFKTSEVENVLFQAFRVAFPDAGDDYIRTTPMLDSVSQINVKTSTSISLETDEHYRCDVFMIMPFRPQLTDKIYLPLIKPLIEEELGLVLRRGDHNQKSSEVVVQRVWKYIENSDVVIADCTVIDGETNGNVYYEIGYADALEKNVILISQRNPEKLPFDVRHRDIILYEDSVEGAAILRKSLKEQIQRHKKGK